MATLLLLLLSLDASSTTTTKMATTATAFVVDQYSHRQHRVGGGTDSRGGRSFCNHMTSMKQPFLPNFCSECGSNQMVIRIPDGDERPRAVCDNCTTVVYSNPKVVVSCVIIKESTDGASSTSRSRSVLLAKRNIEPRKGYWGIPQGYMEHGETTREACVREVHEETGLTIDPASLKFRGLLNVPGSVQIVYESRLDTMSLAEELSVTTTMESSEIGFFDVETTTETTTANDDDEKKILKLPVELCFPTVEWVMRHCLTGHEHHILQKNKLYDATTNSWGESEDF